MSQCWSPWINGDPYVLSRIKSTRSLCLQTKKSLTCRRNPLKWRKDIKRPYMRGSCEWLVFLRQLMVYPSDLNTPVCITRTRRFVLSESIQILFDFVGEEEDATEYFHIQDALSVTTLNSNMSGSLLENNISGSKTLYVHWIQTDDPEFVPALDSTNQVESPNFNNQFTWSPLPSPMSSPGHDGSFSPEGTDLGTILNRLGEKIDHTSCPTSNQIKICRDYTGNVHNILRSSLQAFRRRRFNPEARLDVVFVDSEQTSEGAVDGGGPTREYLRFVEGFNTLGLLQEMRAHPDLFRSMFEEDVTPLKAKDLSALFKSAFRHQGPEVSIQNLIALEKVLGERNFGFDSLKYMNRDMEEKGIVARDCLPPEPRCRLPAAVRHQRRKTPPHGSRQRAAGGSVYFRLMEVEEPEASENPTHISTTRLVVGVISAMVEKESGERNFGFDFLKNMNHDMEEKGIVARDVSRLSPAARC
ncbi:unnamed protein product [Boreogadus saida]